MSVVTRVLCPRHEERTPSCVVYSDGKYYCFSCGASGKNVDIGFDNVRFTPKAKEDISKTRAYIDDLPLKPIRGLMLPADDKFYYVVYPGSDFYKKRRLSNETDNASKYVSPVGHHPPLWVSGDGTHPFLCVVEGEINAASLHACATGVDIVSPGACTNFNLAKLKPVLTWLPRYKRILLFVDNDKAGISAAIKLNAELVPVNPRVYIQPMKADFNEILVKHGKEAVKETMEVQTRM